MTINTILLCFVTISTIAVAAESTAQASRDDLEKKEAPVTELSISNQQKVGDLMTRVHESLRDLEAETPESQLTQLRGASRDLEQAEQLLSTSRYSSAQQLRTGVTRLDAGIDRAMERLQSGTSISRYDLMALSSLSEQMKTVATNGAAK